MAIVLILLSSNLGIEFTIFMYSNEATDLLAPIDTLTSTDTLSILIALFLTCFYHNVDT